MKRVLLVLGLVAVLAIVPSVLSSQQTEILCCRQVCASCGDQDNNNCDFQSVDQCSALDGWEVMDCTDCHGPKPGT